MDAHKMSPRTRSPRQVGHEKRSLLLSALSECFFARAGRHSRFELELFDTVIEIVLASVEPFARAELAHRLAGEERPPPRVLRRLAGDVFEVAEPILLRSPALNEEDLEHFSLHLPQQHLAAIAHRAQVSERISDVLLTRGNESVVLHLTANHGARFSAAGFVKIAKRAEHSRVLCGHLAARPDVPDEIVTRLEPVIRLNLEVILAALAADVRRAEQADLFEQARATLLGRLKHAAGPPPSPSNLLELIARGQLSFDDALVELADADAAMAVARLLAPRVVLRSDVIMRVLMAVPEDPALLLCRAAGLSLNAFSALLRMRRRRRGMARQSPAAALLAYSNLDAKLATRMIKGLSNQERRDSGRAPS